LEGGGKSLDFLELIRMEREENPVGGQREKILE
jgi:hypothetical protein